jgi:tRNA(Ile)-lysidine synthase
MSLHDSSLQNDGSSVTAAVRRALESWSSERGITRGLVAFSGGLDSTVLLAAVARSWPGRVRAVHVDHGLHPKSADWAAHCTDVAARLGASCSTVRVTVPRGAGRGLEAAARDARYRALAEAMQEGEAVLTAHHADDQLETVLLRLLRGAGVRGMRGIHELAPFAAGWLGRPLLRVTRRELHAQALAWGLTWLDDPANTDERHDRNYLRRTVVPEIIERWPSAAASAARLAEQMADAEAILETVAAADARAVADPRRVPVAVLVALDAPRQRNVLRHLVRGLGLAVPSAEKLEELRAAAVRRPANGTVQWAGAEARLFREHLYLLPALAPARGRDFSAVVGTDRAWNGPEGEIRFEPANDGAGLPGSWLDTGLTLRFRAGGEHFRPLDRERSRSLKDWLHDAGIVPWMRDRVPLLYRGDRLVAIADLSLGADTAAAPPEQRWRVVWTHHPLLY